MDWCESNQSDSLDEDINDFESEEDVQTAEEKMLPHKPTKNRSSHNSKGKYLRTPVVES